jgi:hypothetical protein
MTAKRKLNFFSEDPTVRAQEELNGQQIEREFEKQQKQAAAATRQRIFDQYGVDIKTGNYDPERVEVVATAGLEGTDPENNNLTRSDFEIPSP